jgi:hypothetical protein
MLNLDNIKIEIREIDISKMVTGVTIYESVFGMLKGAISIKDGINFFDNFIGTELADVSFTFEYLGNTYGCGFYMDGISNMKIAKQQKNYIIHLKSIYTPVFAETINNTFTGRSDQIINKIFTDISAEESVLHIDTITDTKGRYIAPNIAARESLYTLVNNAYDIKKTGMFLYQRFFDNNACRLTSLGDMLESSFVDENNQPVSIKQAVINQATMGARATLGTADKYELKEYNMDFIQKLEDGVWGEAVNTINLDETTRKANITKEATSIPKTKFKLSDKLYTNNVKSIFSSRGDVAVSSIQNHKFRVFNTIMEVNQMVALPNLGAGMCINVSLGGGNQSSSKQDGKYLVKHIQHNFTIDGGDYMYTQDLGLARE